MQDNEVTWPLLIIALALVGCALITAAHLDRLDDRVAALETAHDITEAGR